MSSYVQSLEEDNRLMSLLRSGNTFQNDYDYVSEDLSSKSSVSQDSAPVSHSKAKPKPQNRAKQVNFAGNDGGKSGRRPEASTVPARDIDDLQSLDSDLSSTMDDRAAFHQIEANLTNTRERLRATEDKLQGTQSALETAQYEITRLRKSMGTPIVIGDNSISPLTQVGGGRVKYVACGDNHCLALTEDGQVYAWGRGAEGQLGMEESRTRNEPTKISFDFGQVRSVFAAGNHSFAISKTGNVYAWGDNSSGQLGTGDKVRLNRPTLVKALQEVDVVFISGGRSHSVAISDDGSVFTWGDSNYGQLGHGDKIPSLEPKVVKALAGENVRSANATDNQTILIAEGDVKNIPTLPDKANFEQRISALQQSLTSLKRKRTEYAARIIEDLRELRRQCGAIEREMGKENKEGSVLIADCRFVSNNSLTEEQYLDFEKRGQLESRCETLQRENELLKSHMIMKDSKAVSDSDTSESLSSKSSASSKPSKKSGSNDGDSDGGSQTSVETADLEQLPDLVRKRFQLLSKLQRGNNDSQKLRQWREEVGHITEQLRDIIKLEFTSDEIVGGGGGAGIAIRHGKINERAVLELVKQINTMWADLKSCAPEAVTISKADGTPNENPTVRELLTESNVRIAKFLDSMESKFREHLAHNAADVYSLMPQMLLELAKSRRKLNDFTEGVLIHTMQRLDDFQQEYKKWISAGDSGGSILGLGKNRLC